MSGNIKNFSIIYDPINESNTFTNGDIIQGRLVVEVNKELRIDKLYIKCKGDAKVEWTESNTSANTEESYSAHERYFKLKQIIIWDKSKIGTYGSIKYVLDAKLSRSWKIPQTTTKEFTFVSNVFENAADLMSPLSGSVDKKMKLFTSGSVVVTASTDKKGYMSGERIKVETHIENSSSRALKLKFKLEQKQTFFAQSKKKYSSKVIFKALEDPIPSRSKKTFTSRLRIPSNLDLTIPNCNIINVHYILKVYLDVPYAKDPEILLPLVIIPTGRYGIPQECQGASYPSQSTHEAMRRGSTVHPSLVSFPNIPSAAAAFGPAQNVYPGVYPPTVYPVEPPPSYADIFPDMSASGVTPSLLHLSPPPYNCMDLSHACQYLTPEGPNTAGFL
ncbi:Arrestin domain-containing protein 3 [Bagarius yarrelli]|uniref:Arrestin domain-containing protein 3 n=1 Tax=Bagarius yarrelli TaxID=175774 RepID=A0A556U5B8_BAGYA|nr:Arrestin domain-containing protein 3 [Bagarius yarrelli]